MSISDARKNFAALVESVRSQGEPIYLTRNGHASVAIIDSDQLDRLIELAEDMADIRAAADARQEMQRTSDEPVPWEDIKAELGLV